MRTKLQRPTSGRPRSGSVAPLPTTAMAAVAQSSAVSAVSGPMGGLSLTARTRLESEVAEKSAHVARLLTVIRQMSNDQVGQVEMSKALAAAREELVDKKMKTSKLEAELEELKRSVSFSSTSSQAAREAALQQQQDLQAVQATLEKLQKRYDELVEATGGFVMTPRKGSQTTPRGTPGPSSRSSVSKPATLAASQKQDLRIRDTSFDAIQAHLARLADESKRQAATWGQVRAGFLAYFCRRLRSSFSAERRARLDVEGQVLVKEVGLLVQAQQQTKQAAQTVQEFKQLAVGVMRDSLSIVSALRQQAVLPIRNDMRHVVATNKQLLEQLQQRLEKFYSRQDKGVQTLEGDAEQWVSLVARLMAKPPPGQLLTRTEVTSFLAEFYSRCVELQAGASNSGGMVQQDSVFSSLMQYFSNGIGGDSSFDVAADDTKQGALATVLHSCLRQQEDSRVAMFTQFTGISSLHPLPTAAWRFFLQLLQCLREIHNPARFNVIMRDWGGPAGVVVSLQSVVDLVGNCYNVDNPASLEVVRFGMLPLIQKSRTGYVVDLDQLLHVLVNDFLAGNCPREPLLAPRHLPDSSIAIMFNIAANQGAPMTTAAPQSGNVAPRTGNMHPANAAPGRSSPAQGGSTNSLSSLTGLGVRQQGATASRKWG